METLTKEVGFVDKLKATEALVSECKTLTVKSADQFDYAKSRLDAIRVLEKELEAEYKAHPIIVEAKQLQILKTGIATMLEEARKGLKNGPMLQYEKDEEAKRLDEERRIASEFKAKADKEAAELAEIERKRAEAARKEAERARKRGDEEAVRLAQERQAQAQAEAARIKEEAKTAILPIVVIPKTAPAVTRRTVKKFRIINEALIPRQYLTPDMVKLGGVVRALGMAANIPGIECYEKSV